MRRYSPLAFVIAAALLLPGVASGQAKVGTTGVNFLKIGPSARAMGMAEAFLPIADDASALYYNPGGLVNLERRELIFTHVVYPAGINFDFIGGVQPLPQMGAAVGAAVTALYTDAMNETTPEHPFGTGRTFTASDFAAAVSFSQRLTDKFSVGVTGRYIQENLADEVAQGWSADVGTYYDTGWRSLKIAMLVSNFGPDMKFVSTPFPLPIIFRFAASADLYRGDDTRLTAALEGIHPNDNVEELHLGFEYAWRDFAMLRLGRKLNGWKRDTYQDFVDDPETANPYVEYPVIDEEGALSLDGFTFGGGLNIKRIGLKVDYAYANFGFFGAIHRFTLGYRFRR